MADASGGLDAGADDATEVPADAPSKRSWPRLGTVFAVGWVAVVVFAGLFGPWLPLPDPDQPLAGPVLSGPTWSHPFGTDVLGRDLLSQVVAGARVSLLVGGISALAGVLAGGAIGLTAARVGGRVDAFIVWCTDVVLAFPSLVLALALVTFMEPSLTTVVLAVTIVAIPLYVRIARISAVSVSQELFVQAAEAIGAGRWRIATREVGPSVFIGVSAYAALGASVAIIAEGGLAYLGLGDAATTSWGTMIAEGQKQLRDGPQALLAPTVVLFCTIVALNVISDRAGAAIDNREVRLG